MLFNEPSFIFLLLPLTLALYFLVPARWPNLRNTWLVAVSVIFYAWGGKHFVFVILGSIVFNYAAAVVVDRCRDTRHGRFAVGLVVALNLALLGWFKYAGFLGRNLNAAAGFLGLGSIPVPQVVLPIGISFFTFHAISYVVDVYRRDAAAQKHPVHAALYLLLFPQLIAGPIIRYRQIAGQLARRVVTREHFAFGIRRFVIGLGKKTLLANTAAVAADRIFAIPVSALHTDVAWLGVVCYAIQIYFDFSGYSDMAVGLGAMFGFRFPENFDYPYISQSIREFWRRWHMSLSAWLRDYLYIPLGGSRVAPARVYVNLITVFFLCGLWHGASWRFVVWGLYYGVFLVLERLGLEERLMRLWRPVRHAYALLVVTVGWVFFRADTLSGAVSYLGAMFGLSRPSGVSDTIGAYADPVVITGLIAGTIASLPVIPALAKWSERRAASRPGAGAILPSLSLLGVVCVFVACAALIAARTYSPFIYFQF